MRNVSVILSSLALIGVLVLFGMQMSGNKQKDKHSKTTTTTTNAAPTTGRIAYVDIDSLEANYTYFKKKKDEFARRQTALESELQRSAQQMEQKAADLQRRYQAQTLTEAEAVSSQKQLQQMQQSFETRRQSMTAQLLKEQEASNAELQKRLDAFLEDYVKEKGYDYVLSYAKAGSILYANQSLNITQDVIDGMNELASDSTSAK